jgi:hypothetical protein
MLVDLLDLLDHPRAVVTVYGIAVVGTTVEVEPRLVIVVATAIFFLATTADRSELLKPR